MNARFHKLFISTMAVCCSVLLLFPVTVRNIYAESDNNLSNIQDLLFGFPSDGYYSISNPSYPNRYYRIRRSTGTSPSTVVNGIGDYLLFYYSSSNDLYGLYFSFGENHVSTGLYTDSSTDGITWTFGSNLITGNANTFTGSGLTGTATTIYYKNKSIATNYNFTSAIPVIHLKEGQTINTILQVLSYNLSDRPWGTWSSSSGGLHFPNGSSLNSEQRARYEQIYIVMDVTQDNSVTEEEVNFYNSTYNTDYDFSLINDGDTFTELQFLEYIATEIQNGNDNPGGGTGSGGSGSSSGAGITIGDGSFTQTQSQTIEENAVNVTVNNDNNLNQENTQWLNSIINNNVGGEEQQNAFENAIGSISGFTGIARSFATLAAAVLGFLPSWVTVLLGVMFAILFVFIVFRLIHLFI